jgi:hypothetical protein
VTVFKHVGIVEKEGSTVERLVGAAKDGLKNGSARVF